MGQYYLSINLDKKTYMSGHKYDNGIKLMEHSYIENNFVQTFEHNIADKPTRVVWAGDYADGEKVDSEFYKELEDKAAANREDELEGETLYDLCDDIFKEIQPEENLTYYRWLINMDKKQYIDKNKLLLADGWEIHPLPLLTAEGNNRGGGDYDDTRSDFHLVGTWARDRILVTNTDYIEKIKSKGYTELITKFKE